MLCSVQSTQISFFLFSPEIDGEHAGAKSSKGVGTTITHFLTELTVKLATV